MLTNAQHREAEFEPARHRVARNARDGSRRRVSIGCLAARSARPMGHCQWLECELPQLDEPAEICLTAVADGRLERLKDGVED